MGAIKRTAALCQTPSLPSVADARSRRAGDPSTTVVEGGGVVRLASGEYHAAALARYDGRRVTVRPTASAAVLEVRVNGRLLCHAGLIGFGDDDTGSVPAFVPRAPRGGGGSARLRLPSDAASRWLGSASSAAYSTLALTPAGPHHDEPRQPPIGPRTRPPAPEAILRAGHPTTKVGAGSARRRAPDLLTAPARGPPVVPSAPRTAARHRHAAESPRYAPTPGR
jgi:hypothetical protein